MSILIHGVSMPKIRAKVLVLHPDGRCVDEFGNAFAVDARPTEKGEWIDMGDFEQCSHCAGTHLKEIQTVYGKAIWIKSDFCPNCGTPMKGE